MTSRDLVRISWAVLYFTDQHLAPFYRLLYKITNVGDIDLQFSGSILDINIDNPAKFREDSILEVAFLKIRFSGILTVIQAE